MNDPLDAIPPQRLRTMQIIAWSLVSGVVIATGFMAYLVYQNNGDGLVPPAGPPLVTLIAAVAGTVNVALSFTLTRTQTRAAVRRIAAGTWRPPGDLQAAAYDTDTMKLLFLRQTTMIVRLALLESVAFFCAIAYLLEGQMYVLIGVAVALALMVAEFPTEAGLRAWLERQAEAVRQVREEASAAPEA